jgi:hypothetical protein
MALSGGWRRHDHARHMSAGRTLIGNQSRLAGDRSDGHHVFHGRSAFCTGRNSNVRFTAPLFIDSVFIRHGTRPFRQGCCNVFVSLKVTAYPSIGSLPDIANLRTADVGLRNRCAGCPTFRRARLACDGVEPAGGIPQALNRAGIRSASQNDICTRRLRAMRSSGAEISASISFAQTWPATFDVNSRRTVNVRPLTA